MARRARHSRSHALQVLVATGALVLLGAAYLALMRATIDLSRLDARHTASDRDGSYFILHVGLMLVAALTGFGLGKWLNGLGVAYAVLFVVVLALAMVLAQVGSYELACAGHNDLIRHWTC